MTTTSHLAITLLEQSQAQKEITVNTALTRIDALLNCGAIDKDLNTPPGSPAEGDVYVVAASSTGDWAGKDGQVAYFEQIWRFIVPNEGLALWVNDENILYTYDGTNWIKTAGGAKRSAYIPAALMRPSSSGGCAALSIVATAANKPDVQSLDFDASAEESAEFSLCMPKSWDTGTITAAFEWSHATAAGSYDVVWGMQAVAVGDADSIAATFGTAQELTDTGGASDTLYKSAESAALTIAGTPQEMDTVYFRIYRKAASGSDTLTVDARLHGVVIFYNAIAPSED